MKKILQLKNMSNKKRILLAVIGIVIITGVAVMNSFNSKKNMRKENMEAAFTVETAKIERQTLAKSISATGTVASAESKTVNTSLKDLEVAAVYVKEGDYVEEGTIICEFDSSDYEKALSEAQHNASINAQIDALNEANNEDSNVRNAYESVKDLADTKNEATESYDEADEDLDDAESDLSKAKTNLNSAKAKYDAIADELKSYPANGILKDAEDAYNQKVSELAKAKAALAEAEKELANAAEADKAAKEQAVEAANGVVTTAEAAVKEAKEDYDLKATRYNELLAIETAYKNAQSAYSSAEAAVTKAEQALTQAEASLEQTEEKLDSAWETYDEAVEKSEQQAEIDALQDQLISQSQEEKTIEQYTELIEDCVVRAAMSGVITSLKVTEGNIFEGGDVYSIQDNENFIVTSSVDEYDITSIEKGMPAYIKTDATGDIEMTGEVIYVAISPASTGGSMGAISNSASYTIKVAIDEADEKIRAGMTAKLSISLEESKDTLTVPYDAVTTTPDGSSTITIDADGEKKTISVKTGLETDYYTEVISDEISEGMTVYLTTPMITSMPQNTDMEDQDMFNMFNGGGERPSGGFPGGGERPSGGFPGGGGMPSGGPGGF